MYLKWSYATALLNVLTLVVHTAILRFRWVLREVCVRLWSRLYKKRSGEWWGLQLSFYIYFLGPPSNLVPFAGCSCGCCLRPSHSSQTPRLCLLCLPRSWSETTLTGTVVLGALRHGQLHPVFKPHVRRAYWSVVKWSESFMHSLNLWSRSSSN
jgi:hypothetical protein